MVSLGPRPRELRIPTEAEVRRRVRRTSILVFTAFLVVGLVVNYIPGVRSVPGLAAILGVGLLVGYGAVTGYLLLVAGRREIALIQTTAVFIEGLPVGVAFFDETGRIAYANPAIGRFTGYRPEDVVGKLAAAYVVADDRARLEREFEKAQRGESSVFELRLMRADGRALTTVVTALPFMDGTRFDGTLAVVSDVTEFLEARTDAERYRHLSSFALDAVTHDLSNRMQAVVTRATLASALLPEGEARLKAAVGAAVDAAERASKLLKEVKLIAAAERERWPTRPTRVGALIERAVALADLAPPAFVASEMAQGTAETVFKANELAPVAIAKLLEEAADGASKEASAQVTLHAELEGPGARQVMLRVEGLRRIVSDADLRLLLATPAQIAQADTPWRGGLRLPLAAAILQALGWEVRAVRGRDGRGTVFEVAIPVPPT